MIHIRLPEAEAETQEAQFRGTADRKFRDRLQIILPAHKGRPRPDIAADRGVHRKIVTRWLNACCDGGLDSLRPRKAKGEEAGIPAALAGEIKGWVIGGPASQGLDRANRTHEELADHLKRVKGIDTSRSAMGRRRGSWWELSSVRRSFERGGEFTRSGGRHARTAPPRTGSPGPGPGRPDPGAIRRRHPGDGPAAGGHHRRHPLRGHRVRPAGSRPRPRRRRLRRTPPPKSGYATSAIDCPHCGRRAAFHSYRAKTVETLGGALTCRRAYYHCGSCGRGSCPWDERVGLTAHRLSPAVERLATLCGAVADSFAKGAELLTETAGIRLGESTVERTTEAVSERVAEHLRKGRTFGGKRSWGWFRDARGRTVGYLGLDATGVRQQGVHGAAADGRMAYVGMIFNPLPDRERVFEGLPRPGEGMRARYVSGLYPLAEMGPLLRRQAWQVGLDEAETWVALSDGGVGLEAFLRGNFPRVEAVILDFFHATEHLAKLAAALHPGDGEAALDRTKGWSRLLREEGGVVLIAVLEAWEWPGVRGLAAVREEVLGHFRNQVHRMDDPSHEANGWFIGSGAVESGCKTVVGARLKGSGMRWGEAGAHAVCHVRALYRSEHRQWIDFWRRSTAA